MAASGSFESVAVVLRAVEGLGLLFLGVVLVAAGSVIKRKAARTVQVKKPMVRRHHRTG